MLLAKPMSALRLKNVLPRTLQHRTPAPSSPPRRRGPARGARRGNPRKDRIRKPQAPSEAKATRGPPRAPVPVFAVVVPALGPRTRCAVMCIYIHFYICTYAHIYIYTYTRRFGSMHPCGPLGSFLGAILTPFKAAWMASGAPERAPRGPHERLRGVQEGPSGAYTSRRCNATRGLSGRAFKAMLREFRGVQRLGNPRGYYAEGYSTIFPNTLE